MTKNQRTALAGIAAITVWYLIFVFISLNWNPFTWPVGARGLFAVAGSFVTLITCVFAWEEF